MCYKLRSSFPARGLYYSLVLSAPLSLLCTIFGNAPKWPVGFLVKENRVTSLCGHGCIANQMDRPEELPLIIYSSICDLEKRLSPTRNDLMKQLLTACQKEMGIPAALCSDD